jgi:hypothetical protein
MRAGLQDWGCSSVVEHLPSTPEAMASILSISKKKKKKKVGPQTLPVSASETSIPRRYTRAKSS